MIEFQAWAKIPRLHRNFEITEKIDGTNGILVWSPEEHEEYSLGEWAGLHLYAGSRKRWITPEDDNHGFASWAKSRAEGLRALGEGRHYGEWWGAGIQRRYDQTHKWFSLFNVDRYLDVPLPFDVGVVPRLAITEDVSQGVREALELLRQEGSVAAPGFAKPEGIVVRHMQSGIRFKALLENDDVSKTEALAGVGRG